MASLKSLLGKEILFFDGGTGSVLQQQGLKPGELPETWNVRFSEKIINLHYEYFCAGANIVKTNSFGAYESKFSDDELSSIIKGAVNNANEARNRFTKENPNQKPSKPSKDFQLIKQIQGKDQGNIKGEKFLYKSNIKIRDRRVRNYIDENVETKTKKTILPGQLIMFNYFEPKTKEELKYDIS